jgi:hypothetical protein
MLLQSDIYSLYLLKIKTHPYFSVHVFNFMKAIRFSVQLTIVYRSPSPDTSMGTITNTQRLVPCHM